MNLSDICKDVKLVTNDKNNPNLSKYLSLGIPISKCIIDNNPFPELNLKLFIKEVLKQQKSKDALNDISNLLHVRNPLDSNSMDSNLLSNNNENNIMNFTSTIIQKPLIRKADKSRNRYDNLIEKLQRKYCSHDRTRTYDDDDDDDDDEGNESGDESNISGDDHNNNNKVNDESKVIKRKRIISQAEYDDYDFEDPFIDDSEDVAEMKNSILMKKVKTKHNGFFISTGTLDVENLDNLENDDDYSESEEETPKKDQKKRERRKRVMLEDGSTVLVSRDDTNNVGVDIKNKNKKNLSKPIGIDKIQNILNKVNSKTNVSTITSSTSDQSSNLSPKVYSNTVSSSTTTLIKSKIDLTNTMNESTSINSNIINIDDSNNDNSNLDKDIKKLRVNKPKPLWQPNEEIIQAINKFKSIINEKYSNGKIISKKDKDLPIEVEALLLQVDKIVFKSFGNSIMKFSGYLENLIEILGGDSVIKSRKLQSIINRIRNRDELEIINKKITETLDLFQLELKNLITESPPQVINSISKNETIMDVSQDKSVKNNDIIIESKSEEIIDNTIDITTDNVIDKLSERSVVKVPIYYKYQCRWNQKLKSYIVLLEELTIKKIKLENSYIEMLSPSQKVEFAVLNDKKELFNLIKTISNLFPDSCSNGDSSAIRKYLSGEKNRLKKLSAVNASTTLSSSAIGNVAVVKNEMKKKISEASNNKKSSNKLYNNSSSTINSTIHNIIINNNKFASKSSHSRVIYNAKKIYEYNMTNNINNEENLPNVGNVFKEINYNVEDFKCITE